MKMTRQKAREVIEAMVKLRGLATDEQAAEVAALYPEWRADAEYKVGERVLYKNVLYKVLLDHTAQEDWNPADAASLFAEILIPDENVIYPWQQPESTNPYKKGDKVSHNDKIWVSTVDGNVWEPGYYGWEEVIG